MKDKEKVLHIGNLLKELIAANKLYIDEDKGSYFDYDNVIELLQKTNETIDSTARCPRPNKVPSDIPWCESMDVEFDPFVYRGDMSIEDFRQAQSNYLDDMKDNNAIAQEDEDMEI